MKLCLTLVSCFLFLTASVFAADGWASTNGGTTGGAGGTVVTVTNAADLEYYAELGTTPYIIQVSGTINIGGSVEIRSNKTLRGLNSSSTLIGQIGFHNRDSNIIIERLTITNPSYGEGDGINLKEGMSNVFVTKCTIYNTPDGLLDISNESDLVTVSWCKFYYTSSTPAEDHRFACLIGDDDEQEEDRGKLRTTFHHNWWANRCKERMPRVRFGQVHLYNNYYSNLDSGGYCIGVGVEANIRVENNYFNGVNNPWANYYTGNGADGKIGWNTGNVFYYCSQPTWATNNYSTIFTPPYSYTMDAGANVRAIVQAYAGAATPYPPHWYYTLYGDFDKDGEVEADDLGTFADYWLETTDIDDADYDDSGRVDSVEFAEFAKNWQL